LYEALHRVKRGVPSPSHEGIECAHRYSAILILGKRWRLLNNCTSCPLYSQEGTPVSTEYEAEWVIETSWKRDICLAPVGSAIPDCPALRDTTPTFQFAQTDKPHVFDVCNTCLKMIQIKACVY